MSPAAVKIDLVHLIGREAEAGGVGCMQCNFGIFEISNHRMSRDDITALQYTVEQGHFYLRCDILQYDLERHPVIPLVPKRWHAFDRILPVIDAMRNVTKINTVGSICVDDTACRCLEIRYAEARILLLEYVETQCTVLLHLIRIRLETMAKADRDVIHGLLHSPSVI